MHLFIFKEGKTLLSPKCVLWGAHPSMSHMRFFNLKKRIGDPSHGIGCKWGFRPIPSTNASQARKQLHRGRQGDSKPHKHWSVAGPACWHSALRVLRAGTTKIMNDHNLFKKQTSIRSVKMNELSKTPASTRNEAPRPTIATTTERRVASM